MLACAAAHAFAVSLLEGDSVGVDGPTPSVHAVVMTLTLCEARCFFLQCCGRVGTSFHLCLYNSFRRLLFSFPSKKKVRFGPKKDWPE